jgi:hypothetical protein
MSLHPNAFKLPCTVKYMRKVLPIFSRRVCMLSNTTILINNINRRGGKAFAIYTVKYIDSTYMYMWDEA